MSKLTNLELAAQQGNQCGPNLIAAQAAGEINTGLSQDELLQQGSRAPEMVVDANKEAETENLVKAKEQYSQAGPLLIEAANAGELTSQADDNSEPTELAEPTEPTEPTEPAEPTTT